MGNCLKYCLSFCCCGKNGGPMNPRDSSKSPKVVHKVDTDPAHEEEETAFISEEKLKKEALKSIRGGASSYASLKAKSKQNCVEHDSEIVRKTLDKRNLKVLDICGTGNYATVYKVVNTKTKKYYAVKVIDILKIGANYRDNFLPNEVKILKRRPKHSNIVRIYSMTVELKKVWITMELAENGTMTDYIQEHGALTEEAAHWFLGSILNGMNELHIRSIAHRDLKLENILLSQKYVPKISDFSYAIVVNPDKPLNQQFCGSLPYLSPQVIQRLPYNPLISDVWSLGVCFYILLNDGLPFKIESDDSIMLNKQMNREWKFRKTAKLSFEIKEIVTSMLEPIPESRTTTRQLKLNPWFKRNDST